ncbi:MAG: MBL fold metallo-hydrolase [Dehalococcoidales bacterium]|nr:MBL fold metallo-hydrolase [Dehalococcoidales bacterium]
MHIQVLGAHNCESQNSKLVSLLIDDVLAIDAGALTSSLSFEAQQKIKAILLTHHHYDHIRDIPTIAMNLFLRQATINVYSIPPVYDALVTHLLNDELYSNFLQQPAPNPTVRFTVIESDKPLRIEGYTVLAVPVNHNVPTVGYQVASADGKVVFYTSDTGPGLADCWQRVSPQLLITEVTAPDKYKQWAAQSGHLAPSLLKQELTSFRELNGYLPQVVVVHMSPHLEKEIEAEIAAVSKALGGSITLAYEGMELNL